MVDRWFKCEDMESFKYARMLIKEEGMLCGEGRGGEMRVVRGGRAWREDLEFFQNARMLIQEVGILCSERGGER